MKCWSTRLTEEEVARVLKMVQRGTPTANIAAHLGVNIRTIQRIVKANRES